MFPRWIMMLPAALILIGITACSSPGGEVVTTNQAEPPAASQMWLMSPTDTSGDLISGSTTEWPAYIPADIPVFAGKIRNVMEAPGSRVRIFYEEVTQKQLEDYLHLLAQQGFELEYIVYVQEGFPDNSEERLKKGDYDAVDITKGEYHMNIGYGEGDIAYDIYISGFDTSAVIRTPIPTSDAVRWPEAVYDLIPQPANCPLLSVEQVTPQKHQIACQPEHNSVGDEYKQALQAAGFLPNLQLPAADGSLDGSIYAWGSWEISVDQPDSGGMLITIVNTTSPAPIQENTWPVGLQGLVPEPGRCALGLVTQLWGTQDFMINCTPEDRQVVLEYLDQLSAAGFSETRRLQTPDGLLLSADFEKDGLRVELMAGTAATDLIIMVRQTP